MLFLGFVIGLYWDTLYLFKNYFYYFSIIKASVVLVDMNCATIKNHSKLILKIWLRLVIWHAFLPNVFIVCMHQYPLQSIIDRTCDSYQTRFSFYIPLRPGKSAEWSFVYGGNISMNNKEDFIKKVIFCVVCPHVLY